MRKRIIYILMAIFVAFGIFMVPVSADTGPKPETHITIKNLPKDDYILGVFVKTDGYAYGPHYSYSYLEEYLKTNPDQEYYKELEEHFKPIALNVTAPEGYKLFCIGDSFKDATNIEYENYYYFPKEFKLVIYSETTKEAMLFEDASTYAFSSYFVYDYTKANLTLVHNYNYASEILGFLVRLAVTLVVELGLAYLFKFRGKSFIILAIINLATQIGLNVSLNLITHYNGKQGLYTIAYIFIELFIVAVEACIFRIFLTRGKENTKKWIITYTILANVLSFGIGMLLWFIW